jgi:hypothetical protein
MSSAYRKAMRVLLSDGFRRSSGAAEAETLSAKARKAKEKRGENKRRNERRHGVMRGILRRAM